MLYSNELSDLVHDIITGKVIAVRNSSYDPATKFYSVAWTIESEIEINGLMSSC